MRAIEVLEILTDLAKQYVRNGDSSALRNKHMNELTNDDKICQEHIEAIIVDFINYVGISNGVDYGLYTKDIK
jgi:hypothetical protein